MGILSREQEQAMFAELNERADFKKGVTQQLVNMRTGSVPASDPNVVRKASSFFNTRKVKAIEKVHTKKAQKAKQRSEEKKEFKKITEEGKIIEKQIDLRRQLQSKQITREQYDDEVLKLRSGQTLERLQASRKVLPAFDSHALDEIRKREDDLKKEFTHAEQQIQKREAHLKERLDKKEITEDEFKKLKETLDESAQTQRKILTEKESALKNEKKTIQEEGTGSREELLKQQERDFEKSRHPISIMPSGSGHQTINPTTGLYDSHLSYDEQKELGVERPTATIMIKEGRNQLIPIEVPVISKADYDLQKENLKADATRKAEDKVSKDETKAGIVDVNNMSPEQKLALISVAPQYFSKRNT